MSRSKSASKKKQISEFTLRITVVFNYTFAYINICSAAFSVKEQLQHFAAKKKCVFFKQNLKCLFSNKCSNLRRLFEITFVLMSQIPTESHCLERSWIMSTGHLSFWQIILSQKVFEILTQTFKVPFLNTNDGTLHRLYPIWSGLGRQASSSGDATLLWPLDCKHLRFPSGHIMEAGLPALSYDRYLIKHTTPKIFHPLQGHWFVMSYFHIETEGY